MARIRLDRDLRSVTEFRAGAAAFIDRVRSTKRPLVLTQHGRGAAVLVDIAEYERMTEIVEGIPAPDAQHGPIAAPHAHPSVDARHDPVNAYKEGVDRSLLRANLNRPVGERLRRLGEMARFAESLRAAGRKAADR